MGWIAMGGAVGAGGGSGLGTDGSTVEAAPAETGAEMGATEPSERRGTASSPGAF
jgi:hypothetical protein